MNTQKIQKRDKTRIHFLINLCNETIPSEQDLTGFNICGYNIRYTNDPALLADSEGKLKYLINSISTHLWVI